MKSATLRFTNLERPQPKAGGTEKSANQDNIIELPPPPESKLNLPSKYIWTPHLTTLSQEEKLRLEKVAPSFYPYDKWARIPWSKYHLPISAPRVHQISLSHDTFSDPLPGRLPPLIFK
ncbi:unnamed protein product [Protopolystoma xenopodis]|uniref:Uncharacterized protein n=1 Tax=Protopolystoma xenopodis TaxID=117903 RepID=A0A448X1C4_9PLAT|nr:unnamed protein product [Protopolystoma xenopodis]